jgi:hypothetical protein
MANQYHILHKIPIYKTKFGMEEEYEFLANKLADSGKIRIDDVLKCNFARFTDTSTKNSLMFSDIELSDPKLLEETKAKIQSIIGNRVDEEVAKLKKTLQKYHTVSRDMLLQVARLFVQSAHPIIIHWLILEKVEIFISFSNNIGDMMDMQNWKQNGQNSGMQSTNGRDVAIFVSCGGDPLADTSDEHPEYGDGLPAIARLQIIAGQETGHYADIMRDDYGKQVSRHSADFVAKKAKENVRIARIKDLERCDRFLKEMNAAGLSDLTVYDSILKIHQDNNTKSITRVWYKILSMVVKIKIQARAKKLGWFFVKNFLHKDEFAGLILRAMCLDMRFNLAPKADVYVGGTVEETEAIACVEALARVPQQVNKWGHLATEYFMRDLYHIYYGQVIPSLIDKYEKVTKKSYVRNKHIISQDYFNKIKNYFSDSKASQKIEKLVKKSRSSLN